ncbi:hypothetical protein [Bradyrhizobium sp. BR 1432]|uniref:hypothetical protein n=1 Tax=Bradyrhizobium sp. BR 1432 TaxID=3447966 RepID=UPI003EE57B0E
MRSTPGTSIGIFLICSPVPGWLSAQRFVSIGDGPKYAAMYEVAGRWAFETPEFLKVKGFGPFESLVKNFMRIELRPMSGPAGADRR